jgi:hypothetical protein
MPELPRVLQKVRTRLSYPLTASGRVVVSFAIGLLVALIINYILYRIALPSKPFIYVAF